MKKLLPNQKGILDRMQRGKALVYIDWIPRWFIWDHERRDKEWVDKTACICLVQNGLVERGLKMGNWQFFDLTDKGRENGPEKPTAE